MTLFKFKHTHNLTYGLTPDVHGHFFLKRSDPDLHHAWAWRMQKEPLRIELADAYLPKVLTYLPS